MMSRSRKVTRLVAAAAAALTLPALLAACSSSGSSGSSSGGKVVLTEEDYFTAEPDNSAYNAIMKRCGAEAGVTIKRTPVAPTSIIQKVLQQASAKTLPNFLMLDNPTLQQVAAAGALQPLTDLGVSTSGYPKGILSTGTYKGKVYGLQPTAASIALFYNKDMFTAAGLTPPTTWDELKTDAQKLTTGDTYGLAFSGGTQTEAPWQFLPFMWTNGGNENKIDSAATVSALQYWTDLVNDGSVSKGAVNWSQSDVNSQFMAGKAAMMVNGAWNIPVLAKQANLHYGSVPIPTPKAGETVQLPLGGVVATAPRTKDTSNEKAVGKVVSCIVGDTTQTTLAKAEDSVPAKTALLSQFATDNPELKAFTQGSSGWRSRTAELGANWPKTEAALFQAIQAALSGKSSPQDALTSAAQSIQ
jgi:multiple sugar transport system substrate-binding protein